MSECLTWLMKLMLMTTLLSKMTIRGGGTPTPGYYRTTKNGAARHDTAVGSVGKDGLGEMRPRETAALICLFLSSLWPSSSSSWIRAE